MPRNINNPRADVGLFFAVFAVVAGVLSGVGIHPASAQQTATRRAQTASVATADFQRGYFLQTHQGDVSGAAAAFERVLADPTASGDVRREAQSRLAQCREDLATADLARMMPPDALAYAEISRPGEHVVRVANMLGLIRKEGVQPKVGAKAIPLGDGLFLPEDLSLSPALVAELKKFRGVAAAVTNIDAGGMPEGVVVVHPGDADLVRGLIETGVQVLEPIEPIEGFRAYTYQRQVVLTVTARVLVAARTREQVAAAVARLKDPKADSLASREDFKRLAGDRKDAMLFAYINGPQAVKQLGPQLRGQEGAIARALLDLDHLESIVALVGTTDDSIRVRAQMNLMPGHHNVAYGLIRTAPLTRRSLEHVPKGAAAVVLVGMNPPADRGARSFSTASVGAQPPVSAMDIGREIFGNIDELAVFALPSAGSRVDGQPIPEVGVVFAVKDADKSEALWNQLLALAALVGAAAADAVRDVTIEGQSAKQYRFPGAPPVVVFRADGALVVGTEAAVSAAVKAGSAQNGIADDPAMASLLARLSPASSKAVLVDAGRGIQIARTIVGGRSANELLPLGVALKDLKVLVATDEAPNELVVRAEITGLPSVPALLKMLGSAMPGPTAASGQPQ